MSKLKNALVQKLEKIPGVTHRPWPDRDDGFSTIHFGEKEIAHFHNFNEIDIRLGKKLITEHKLEHPKNSKSHPNRSKGSAYIEVRFNSASELEQITKLIKLIAQ